MPAGCYRSADLMIDLGPEENKKRVGCEKKQSRKIQQHILQRLWLNLLHLQKAKQSQIRRKQRIAFAIED